MPRPPRSEYPHAHYHVMKRGRGRRTIFPHDELYRAFLETLAEVHTRFDAVLHAYGLMRNHYHLLMETPLANLGRASCATSMASIRSATLGCSEQMVPYFEGGTQRSWSMPRPPCSNSRTLSIARDKGTWGESEQAITRRMMKATSPANLTRNVAMYLCQHVGDHSLHVMAQAFHVNHIGSVSRAIHDVKTFLHETQDQRFTRVYMF